MSEPFVGEIRMFGGTFAPMGWSFCDGRLLPINLYLTLFALIGNTYGGDGVTNFALPDLRGRIPVDQGAGYTIGQKGGAETVTLAPGEMPAHSHPATATSQVGGTVSNPQGNVWANWNGLQYSDQAPNAQMNAGVTTSAGGSQPHDNMMPYQAVNFIIAYEGIFPSRD